MARSTPAQKPRGLASRTFMDGGQPSEWSADWHPRRAAARQRGGERLPSRAPRRSSPMADPTPDPERFRAELVAWLEQHAPPSLRGAVGNELEGIWGGRKAKWPNPDAKR